LTVTPRKEKRVYTEKNEKVVEGTLRNIDIKSGNLPIIHGEKKFSK